MGKLCGSCRAVRSVPQALSAAVSEPDLCLLPCAAAPRTHKPSQPPCRRSCQPSQPPSRRGTGASLVMHPVWMCWGVAASSLVTQGCRLQGSLLGPESPRAEVAFASYRDADVDVSNAESGAAPRAPAIMPRRCRGLLFKTSKFEGRTNKNTCKRCVAEINGHGQLGVARGWVLTVYNAKRRWMAEMNGHALAMPGQQAPYGLMMPQGEA